MIVKSFCIIISMTYSILAAEIIEGVGPHRTAANEVKQPVRLKGRRNRPAQQAIKITHAEERPSQQATSDDESRTSQPLVVAPVPRRNAPIIINFDELLNALNESEDKK